MDFTSFTVSIKRCGGYEKGGEGCGYEFGTKVWWWLYDDDQMVAKTDKSG